MVAMLRPLLFIYFLANSHYVFAATLQRRSPWGNTDWKQDREAHGSVALDVSIALVMENIELGIESLLSISDPASAKFGQHWTAQEVARILKPTSYTFTTVLEWLKSSGIHGNRVLPSRDKGRLHLNLTVFEASKLLETEFHHFTSGETGEERVACHIYHLPQSLDEHIDYITATASIPTHKRRTRKQQRLQSTHKISPLATVDCEKYTGPSCLRELYNIPKGTAPHPNNSLGIYEPAWVTWIPEDLDEFFRLFEPDLIGKRPVVERVDGGYMQTDYKILNFNVEPNLDFGYAMALTAPQEVANIQVGDKFQLGNLNNMLAAFDEYYCDSLDPSIDPHFPDPLPGGYNKTADCGTLSPPKVLSISFAYVEAAFPPEYLYRQCLEYLRLGLMGVTVVVSTSDYGTASGIEVGGCINDKTGFHNSTSGRFSPSFPSSCPWVTAVGGTQKPTQPRGNSTSAATGDSNIPPGDEKETAFYTQLGNRTLSSGGGYSNVFPIPLYQLGAVSAYEMIEWKHLRMLQGHFTATGRAYPDISAQAYGYLVVANGEVHAIHGTSGSAPVFASMMTLINNERLHAGKSSVGFVNPTLYAYQNVLNDVTTGGNEGCGFDPAFRAARGWDPVTGLGTPDFEKMRKLFLSLP
ncbi:Aorsin [Dactylellina cionopaga]|nr:Aorsin [Dactylellina cionopaga]